ncbi:protein of unknown function [Latilactobacillus sakei]|nr:protein of unknown function [Latilactobacillus sakei]
MLKPLKVKLVSIRPVRNLVAVAYVSLEPDAIKTAQAKKILEKTFGIDVSAELLHRIVRVC